MGLASDGNEGQRQIKADDDVKKSQQDRDQDGRRNGSFFFFFRSLSAAIADRNGRRGHVAKAAHTRARKKKIPEKISHPHSARSLLRNPLESLSRYHRKPGKTRYVLMESA